MDFSEFPLALTWSLFFIGAMLRGQVIYWLARGATMGALRRPARADSRRALVHRWLTDPSGTRGRALVHHFGILAVPLCYLTIGAQTVVLAFAGAARMPWPTFTLAQIPGAAAWATIYTIIGFAVWEAALSAHPMLLLLALLAAAVIVAALIRRSRLTATRQRELQLSGGAS